MKKALYSNFILNLESFWKKRTKEGESPVWVYVLLYWVKQNMKNFVWIKMRPLIKPKIYLSNL